MITFTASDPFAGLKEFAAAEKVGGLSSPTPQVFNEVQQPYVCSSQGTSLQARYEYHMEQFPPTIVVQEAKGREAADYLQGVVSRFATNGWEFYRVDEIGVQVAPGCLGYLTGIRSETRSHYVITFRRFAE